MVDPRTPVIVGVGQFTENIDDPSYRGMSAVELATEAAKAALTDTGADADDCRQGHRRGRGPATVRDLGGYARAARQVEQLPAVGHATTRCGARTRR